MQFKDYINHIAVVIFLTLVLIISIPLFAQDKPSYLPEDVEPEFDTFTRKSPNRAFALGKKGGWGSAWGHNTVKKARSEAISRCRKYDENCVVIAVNNRIVIHRTPFSSSSSTEFALNRYALFIIIIVALAGSAIFFSRYKRRQAYDPDTNDIRKRSFIVSHSPEYIYQEVLKYARETTGISIYDRDGKTAIIQTTPGILSDGHFFRVRSEPVSSEENRVLIGCRPRIFKFWHLFATGETNRVYEDLREILSDHRVTERMPQSRKEQPSERN